MLKLTLIILLLFLVDVGLGQSHQTTNELQAHEPLEIVVSVTNRHGLVVRGLRQENFHVFIDKIEQKIERLSEVDEPISIGIMIDASGSTLRSAKMQDLAQAISRFRELSNEQNEYFLLAFNIAPELLMDWAPNLEPGLAKLINVRPEQNTAFYDACYVAFEKVTRGRHRKRVLIVISDGQDNLSQYSFKEVREFLRETDIIVHAIALSMDSAAGSALEMEGHVILDELADLSGGSGFFRPSGGHWRRDELTKVVETLARNLRNQYRIRVTPVYKPNEKWHRLKIKLNVPHPSKELKDLSAKAREGFYLVPAQAKEK